MIHILTSSIALSEWTELMFKWLNTCIGKVTNVKLVTMQSPDLYKNYITDLVSQKTNSESIILFLFDCHRLTESLDLTGTESIVMQSECLQSTWFNNIKYVEALTKADRIIDYSLDNIVRLNTRFKVFIPKILFV